MGDILNDLTSQQLLAIRDRALTKQASRPCVLCEAVVPMRKGQKFCSDSCRTTFSNQLRLLNQSREREVWELERQDLVKEIAELRRQLT